MRIEKSIAKRQSQQKVVGGGGALTFSSSESGSASFFLNIYHHYFLNYYFITNRALVANLHESHCTELRVSSNEQFSTLNGVIDINLLFKQKKIILLKYNLFKFYISHKNKIKQETLITFIYRIMC